MTKRYVFEFSNDVARAFPKNPKAKLECDKIVLSYNRGRVTNIEAIKAMVKIYDKCYKESLE